MQQRGGIVKDLRNNLHLLYDFYIVVKANSFSDAAKSNYVSQSNLSRNIKRLEEIMNLKLLNTSNKGFELTNDGLMLYNKLDIMFSNVNSEEMSDIMLTIGTTRNIADILLSKYILKFQAKFPNVKLKVIIDNAESLDIFLSKHKIDVLIDYLPHINYNNSHDLKIEKRTMTREEAGKFYEKNNTGKGRLQYDLATNEKINMSYCEDYFNYFYEIIATHTGVTKILEL